MYLDWESRPEDYYVIDIEGDGFEPSVIWCMCWQNLKTGEKGECRSYEEIREFFQKTRGSMYIGHNILRFDAPHLNRLAGLSLSAPNCIDTLVLSTLYSPSLAGGHSLEAWGERMGNKKTEFNDWSHLSEEMIEYCHQDVSVTTDLYKRLVQTLVKIDFSELSVWIQHRFTALLHRQQQNGFYFNYKEGLSLYSHLRELEGKLEDDIHKVFPPERVLVADRPMFTKGGGYTAIYLKDKSRYILEEDGFAGRYRAYEDVPFNIGSPVQRVERLQDLGWVPREFTKTNKPKPFDKGELSPSLEEFLEENPMPEVELIAKWMSYNGRANMINTWLENYNDDGCIHGKLFVADTLRLRHQAPNTANIPAVRSSKSGEALLSEAGYFTYEARNLWCARPGRVLVGTDAAGLELRMLAHYLNRDEFTRQVVEGDPHQYNADLVGITRPQAKTLIYAVLYGARPPKIASTLGISTKEAGSIRNKFLDKLGVGDLIDECEREQQQGRITLVDGSQVVCPSPHAALNYKLQGSGARVMALGAIVLEANISRLGLDSLKVGDIHDEWQYDCDPDCADEHGNEAVKAIVESGRRLGLNVPLDGTSKKGLTWAETH